MAIDSAKMTRQEMLEAFTRHGEGEHPQDIERAMDTVHEEAFFQNIATGETMRGKAEVRRYYEERFRAFPGWTFTRHAVHVTDDNVISEVTLSAIHRGPLYGVPASGRSISYRMCVVFTFKDGLVLGEREYYDQGTLLQQMGANT